MSGKINAAAIREAKSAEHKELMAIVNNGQTKSARIRALHAAGCDKSTIASLLDIRFQHVRNVLVTQLTGKKEEAPAPRKMVEGDI